MTCYVTEIYSAVKEHPTDPHCYLGEPPEDCTENKSIPKSHMLYDFSILENVMTELES